MNKVQNFKPNMVQIPVIIEDETKLDLPEYIDKPEYVQNKSVGYALQTIGWLLLMLLFMPLITLFLWWYGVHNIYHYVLIDTSQDAHFNILNIGIIILILGGILLSWAIYNWLRFRKKERRTRPENTSLKQFAENFNCTEEDVLNLRQRKNITLYYDDHGLLEKFDYLQDDHKHR